MMMDKMSEINEHVSTIDITCNISHSEVANLAFKQSDKKIQFQMTMLVLNKTDKYFGEMKCIISENKFKPVSCLEKHDKKFYLTKEPVLKYKCFH